MYQNLLVNQAKIDSIDVSAEMIDAEMEQRLRVIEAQIGSRQKKLPQNRAQNPYR